MSDLKKKVGKSVSSLTGGVWNFMMMNNKNTQNVFSSYILVIFLTILILIIFEGIDFRTKELYKEYNALKEARDKVHNIEMTISKEYVIKTSEEYIIEEVERRGLDLHENVKPPKRIYYDD